MNSPAQHHRPRISEGPIALRSRAEARLSEQLSDKKSDVGTQRLLHELEVHRIELEMQNAELQKTRDELEVALEKFTDLYDFAPVGYLSVDESGAILEANLKSASMLNMERSGLVNRSLLNFVAETSRPDFLGLLRKVFTVPKDQEWEALLQKQDGGTLLASFRATSAVSREGRRKWCRVAFGDITDRKRAEEAQRRLEALSDANLELNREIVRRQAVEKALQKSERHQSRSLQKSRHMQGQLRHLSHGILQAQEEERMRISRDLHDEIVQTLVGINVQLAALTREAAGGASGFPQKIARTQRLVEESVEKVHQFARNLRPTLLDDLGLIPALHAFIKGFAKSTGIHAKLRAVAAVERLDTAKRTALFRVAQEVFTNVGRHARASRVEVDIQKLAGCICMKITDDGKSFQVDRVMHGKGGKHLGLLGMKERLEMVGGDFEIESEPGKGTTVMARIPLGAAARGGL
jgi:PAS domain S-box-containing protein